MGSSHVDLPQLFALQALQLFDLPTAMGLGLSSISALVISSSIAFRFSSTPAIESSSLLKWPSSPAAFGQAYSTTGSRKLESTPSLVGFQILHGGAIKTS
ncbi:hypothetical protein ACLOJK_000023 [Asimina triloba]